MLVQEPFITYNSWVVPWIMARIVAALNQLNGGHNGLDHSLCETVHLLLNLLLWAVTSLTVYMIDPEEMFKVRVIGFRSSVVSCDFEGLLV
ncbi:hypothetical protein N7495_005809 [Penicillium taxi]|uniref:uncharacterized protein n=1 Tax=Penicillium taxi TaxID=168475 RepID=UPI0025452F2E|nr:uncharacterized protein N7495_005809 [Penicillium taxi]KAJ5894118.1 hypothetical protein N7495_005809 [Penicillium taxi]